MIALGGNNENGVLTDRKENKLAFGVLSDVDTVCLGAWEDLKDIKVRNTVVTKKAQAIITRGVRMVMRRRGVDSAMQAVRDVELSHAKF